MTSFSGCRTRLVAVFAVALGLETCWIASAGVGHGSLDRTFGLAGKVKTKIGADDAEFGSLALQKDGKLVAAGGSTKGSYGDDSGSDGNFVLVRYGANGSLDRSFGSSGIVKTPSGPAAINHEPTGWATAVAIQPDGKLVAGGTIDGAPCGGFLVVRYQMNGTLDRSFGSSGKIRSDNAVFGGLAVQPDGKLLLSTVGDGGCEISSPGVDRLLRYKPNGKLDPSFGKGGKVKTPLGLGALVTQPDGKVVGAGSRWVDRGSRETFGLVRYNANGSIDRSFGSNGSVTTAGGGGLLAIQPDGKLVISDGSGLIRYNPTGSLDQSFGSGGNVTTPIHSALQIQPDGKLVVAGGSGNRKRFVLVRYMSSGALDRTFGSGGMVTTAFGAGSTGASALVIRPDGKLVAGGEHRKGFSQGVFVIARYQE